MNNNDSKTLEAIRAILATEREKLERRYGSGTNLCGHCIEASDAIVVQLKKLGIPAEAVEGWCVYDDGSFCSDVPWDAHTWVDFKLSDEWYYADITADQFNAGMFPENEFPPIVLCAGLPYGMQYAEPDPKLLEEGRALWT